MIDASITRGGSSGGGGKPTAPSAAAIDKAQLVKAARQLLSSVTRVLLLADRVLVKHILRAEDKVSRVLSSLVRTKTTFRGGLSDRLFADETREHLELH